MFGLSLLLSIGVPLLVLRLIATGERPPIGTPVSLAIITTVVSLYVSTIGATTVRAIVTSVLAAGHVWAQVLSLAALVAFTLAI